MRKIECDGPRISFVCGNGLREAQTCCFAPWARHSRHQRVQQSSLLRSVRVMTYGQSRSDNAPMHSNLKHREMYTSMFVCDAPLNSNLHLIFQLGQKNKTNLSSNEVCIPPVKDTVQ